MNELLLILKRYFNLPIQILHMDILQTTSINMHQIDTALINVINSALQNNRYEYFVYKNQSYILIQTTTNYDLYLIVLSDKDNEYIEQLINNCKNLIYILNDNNNLYWLEINSDNMTYYLQIFDKNICQYWYGGYITNNTYLPRIIYSTSIRLKIESIINIFELNRK